MEKKENLITQKITIFTNHPCDPCWDEAYKEYLEEFKAEHEDDELEEDEEPEQPESEYDYTSRLMEDDWYELRTDLDHIEKTRKENWFVAYTLDLWDGRPRGLGVRPNLKKALDDCFEDYNTVVTSEDGKHIEVEAVHHDGTNTFSLYPISWDTAREIQDMIDEGKEPAEIRDYALARVLPLTYEMLNR